MLEPQTNICLIGGTFDPIHLGHTYIARQAQQRFDLNKVIFLPCRQSPHKLNTNSIADHHRLKMCRLATDALPWAEVSDYDLISPPPSYSWRTAEYFNQLYPHARLYWLMGSDQWNALDRWSRADYFSSLVNIIVFHRNYPPRDQAAFKCLKISGNHPASATAIRNQLIANQPSPWLSPKVAGYIKENFLYSK